jgi:hypothetical protein
MGVITHAARIKRAISRGSSPGGPRRVQLNKPNRTSDEGLRYASNELSPDWLGSIESSADVGVLNSSFIAPTNVSISWTVV